MEGLAQLLREALMESYPYLAEPRSIEALIEDLASRGVSVEDALKELDSVAKGGDEARPLLATDVRILVNSLRRLLTSRSCK